MDNWLPDVNKAWTATTPEGGFRAPSKFGGLGGANFPSSREEVVSFVAFAERLWDLDTPKFAGTFQNQGKRLLKYLPLRLYEIDDVVAALRAAWMASVESATPVGSAPKSVTTKTPWCVVLLLAFGGFAVALLSSASSSPRRTSR